MMADPQALLPPADANARKQAVLGRGSYIVQAPAGSGKTELLVQRFLRLLGEVQTPESIIALTFTRKAAAEMRNRVVDAMHAAASNPEPSAPHQKLTWSLAHRALEQDARQGWGLRQAPRRLRVQTIDSLCSELVRQLPLLTDMGALTDVVEDARESYRAAAEATLDIDSDIAGSDVATLVAHLDGNMERAAQMLASMLSRRDQWLHYIGDDPSREFMQTALAHLVSDELRRVRQAIPIALLEDMTQVAQHSAYFLSLETAVPSHLQPFADAHETEDDERAQWRGFATLFLTAKGDARKTFNKHQGAPTSKSVPSNDHARLESHKLLAKEVLQRLAENSAATTALKNAQSLPDPFYSDSEWRTLVALLRLLKLAAAHLAVHFSESNSTDFGELQTRAIAGLGHPQAPSELLLALDYRIEHLLLDEFQDTSNAQVTLLQKLCAAWSPHDGRSLFIVGDPMQSIYRFRLAEVGNFVNAARNGIEQVALTPLRLTSNFRSTSGIVDWVNASFVRVFPQQDDPALGQITYSSSIPARGSGEIQAVHVHPLLEAPDVDMRVLEAQSIAEVITQVSTEQTQQSVAILVRSRSHLTHILPALLQAGISVEAVELDSLRSRPVVNDLHALLRTLLTPSDKVAWLSVLRAPYCGVQLDDIHTLLARADLSWLSELNGDGELNPSITAQGQARTTLLRLAYRQALRALEQLPLAQVLEQYWLALGGPQSLSAYGEANGKVPLADARAYLAQVRRAEHARTIVNLGAFERQIEGLFALPDARATQQVQVMTIHKSKGLEFDVVLLPGLDRKPRAADKPLLAWQERSVYADERQLVMAPVNSFNQDSGLYDLIRTADAALDDEESSRLLYVATTRAREQLHLFGTISWDDSAGTPKHPSRRSLLAKLWLVLREHFSALAPADVDVHAPPAVTDTPRLLRVSIEDVQSLAKDLQAVVSTIESTSALGPAENATSDPSDATFDLEFDWAGETARHTGTLVHRWLERIAADGAHNWDNAELLRASASFPTALLNLGVLPDTIAGACERVLLALRNTLADATGRWLLQQHRSEETELALTSNLLSPGKLNASGYVVDRTFVDAHGTRWIVDYKTGSHEGGDIENFLTTEQLRYQSQLEGYARLLGALEARPTKLALYFPLLKTLRSWDA